MPSPTCPVVFLPQHHRLPSVRTAHDVSPLPPTLLQVVVASTWTGVVWKLPLTPNCPYPFSPQHHRVPDRTPQVWAYPAVTPVQVVAVPTCAGVV